MKKAPSTILATAGITVGLLSFALPASAATAAPVGHAASAVPKPGPTGTQTKFPKPGPTGTKTGLPKPPSKPGKPGKPGQPGNHHPKPKPKPKPVNHHPKPKPKPKPPVKHHPKPEPKPKSHHQKKHHFWFLAW